MGLYFYRMMKMLFFFITIIISSTGLIGQAVNTTLRSQFDDGSLTQSPHGVYYNDIWGWSDSNGREYAILGTARYTLFIEVTDPENPVERDRILSSQSCTWRDYKTFGHFAYGVSDACNAGLEIFDLSFLPDSVSKVYDSRGLIDNAHNIFIDTITAKLYACGINDLTNDLTILNLNVSPDNPTLINSVNLNLTNESDYIHDLYVRNDTAYLCNGPESRMLIYDMSDSANPSYIGQAGSAGYNHSTWVSENGKVAVVADETHNRPLRVVDLSNLESPQEVSTIKSTLLAPNHTNSLAHNPFIIGNDFVVISYYEDGLQIYKIDSTHKPFRTGYYDTRPGDNNYSGFNGAWGAYPYLPSGNIIVSDVESGLFVITPNFPMKDCKSGMNVSGSYDNHWEIVSMDSLRVSAIYQDNAEVDLMAPQQIILSEGFEISSGSLLEARIEDKCTTPTPLKLSSLQKPKN